jgi:hypothetical protein
MQNIKTTAKEILGYCELKQHNAWFDRVIRSREILQCWKNPNQWAQWSKDSRNETRKYCKNNT